MSERFSVRMSPIPFHMFKLLASKIAIALLLTFAMPVKAAEYGNNTQINRIDDTAQQTQSEQADPKTGNNVETSTAIKDPLVNETTSETDADQQIQDSVKDPQQATENVIINPDKSRKKRFNIPNIFKKPEENTIADNNALLESGLLLDREESGYIDKRHKVHDIAYGEALLDYFNNEYYEALIKTNVALSKNELTDNINHAHLLQVQLYIIEGLPEQAEQALNKIPADKLTPTIKNRVYFQLVRMHTYQGNLNAAKRLLNNNLTGLTGHPELERRILLANIHAIENNKEALSKEIQQLSQYSTPNAYIKFNLANAGIITDNEEFFLPILQELTQTERTDLETRSIQDFANLSIGKYYLKKDDLENAKLYLKSVGYEGLHSSEALYLLAWIELQQEAYKTSFAYWVNLSQRNPGDMYVGKSFLYRPYALEKLNSTHLALNGYMRAAELYDRLISDVDSTIEIVNSEVWLQKFFPPTPDSLGMHEKQSRQPGWLETQKNEANFLLALYSTDHFAIMRQNFWELEIIKQDLEKHRDAFEVFKLQTKTHSEKYDQLIPEAKEFLSSSRMNNTQQRAAILEKELARMNNENDFLAAPSTEQAARLKRIEYAHSLLENLSEEQVQKQKDYLRLLEGINAWEMTRDMNERQWKLRNQYNQLKSLLNETEEHKKQIIAGMASMESMDEFGPVISNTAANLEIRIMRLELLSLKHQKYIRELALQSLNERRREYKNLKAKAKLAAARLQDSIVTGGKR